MKRVRPTRAPNTAPMTALLLGPDELEPLKTCSASDTEAGESVDAGGESSSVGTIGSRVAGIFMRDVG